MKALYEFARPWVLRVLRVRHPPVLKFKQCWLLKNKQDNNNLYRHNRSPDTLGCVLTHLTQRGVSTIPPV